MNEILNAFTTHGVHYHNYINDPKRTFWNAYIERPAMKKQLKSRLQGKKVLDAGCGSGALTILLNEWGSTDVVGVDFSHTLLEIAKNTYPDINFVLADIRKLPFADDSFDVVASSLTLHYVKDFERTVREISRVLNTNGIFVFSCHHPQSRVFQKKRYADGSYHHRIMKKIEVKVYKHSKEAIRNALYNVGMTLESIQAPLPIRISKGLDRDEYEYTSTHPTFIVVRAKKL